MGFDRFEFLGPFGFPNDNVPIFPGSGEVLSIARDGHAAAPTFVLVERGLGFLFAQIPNDYLAVIAAGNQDFGIGGNGDRPDVGWMAPFQAGDEGSSLRIPKLHVAGAILEALAA